MCAALVVSEEEALVLALATLTLYGLEKMGATESVMKVRPTGDEIEVLEGLLVKIKRALGG